MWSHSSSTTTMAEALPIAATAFTIVKLCGELAAYIGGIRNSDKVVDQVYLEIKDLEVVLLEIRKSVSHHGIEKIQNVTIEGHLAKLHRAMGACKNTLSDMQRLACSIRGSGVKKLFRMAVQKLRFDWNSDQMAALRRQIDSQRNVMSFSLQMITM